MLNKFWLLLLFPILLNAQVLKPVKWTTSVKDLGNNEFEVQLKAKIDKGWHLYSQSHPDGGIGIPSLITIEENSNIKLLGKVKEVGKLHSAYSEIFEQDEKYYENNVTYVQKVKVNGDKPINVKLSSETQVCDAEKCLPPEYNDFIVKLIPKKIEEKTESVVEENNTTKKDDDDKLEDNNAVDESVNLPIDDIDTIDSTENTSVANKIDSTQQTNTTVAATNNGDNKHQQPKENKSFWRIFILGFLGGFAALLMPCIFPLIPLTVSVFTKQSGSKSKGIGQALVFGISIIAIYVGLGLLVTALFGATALNALATNPWVNIGFFVLFIVFAISFFGAFEISLPSKWANKTDKGVDKGGLIGVFFMALTLALVSFSCTGPIIGTLLVDSASTGQLLGPAIGMFGFSLALALPFTLFAMFPGWLNSLPKSGGWLNTVKVCLGFIELAFALKFLSNADLVWQAHWLERELFIAIWLAIFFCMGLYLLNFFRMSHDSESKHIGTPRLLFSILTFVFVFYMLPGIWGAPLKLLSGLTPPKSYSESPIGFFPVYGNLIEVDEAPAGMYMGPNQIGVFYDIEKAFEYAEEKNRPVMIDFTGDACANCRKVEDNVWSDPRVEYVLTKEVVVASLYVDRRVDLPKEEQVYSEELERNLKTIGDKWVAYQIKHFQSNAQPLYIIVDKHLNRYNEPLGTELDVDKYLEWLREGINNYKKENP